MDIDAFKTALALYEQIVETATQQYNEIVAQAESEFRQQISTAMRTGHDAVSGAASVDAMRDELLSIQATLGNLQKEVDKK